MLFVVWGATNGYIRNLIWWLRIQTPITPAEVRYGLLFGAYHVIVALATRAVLWQRNERGWSGWMVPPLIVVCLALFIVVRWIGDQHLLPLWGDEPNYHPPISFRSFAIDNLSYGLIPIGFGALVHAVEAQFAALRRQLELAHQQRLSELDLLRAHIAPHFLFNTLNNLYALAQRPGADLSTPIHDLSELMRYAVKNDRHLVPLAEEQEQVMRYIELQRLRYAKALNIAVDFPAHACPALIPPMVLLPLVENAFKHGDPCHAHIPMVLRVEQREDHLHIHCVNAIAADAGDGAPTGNRNLQRRLQLLFDGRATVRFDQADGYFNAHLVIPLEAPV